MTASTITPEQAAAIADYVNNHELSEGVGTAESACSIAAINLALNGRLTDAIPDCMSRVICLLYTSDAADEAYDV